MGLTSDRRFRRVRVGLGALGLCRACKSQLDGSNGNACGAEQAAPVIDLVGHLPLQSVSSTLLSLYAMDLSHRNRQPKDAGNSRHLGPLPLRGAFAQLVKIIYRQQKLPI